MKKFFNINISKEDIVNLLKLSQLYDGLDFAETFNMPAKSTKSTKPNTSANKNNTN